eukprot:scaffold7264_cov75-Phaeocystis_antarctica.AAC.1
MHAVFAGSRKCGLVLHHKEVNTWGHPQFPCAEFAWVGLAHAQRAAAAVGPPTIHKSGDRAPQWDERLADRQTVGRADALVYAHSADVY